MEGLSGSGERRHGSFFFRRLGRRRRLRRSAEPDLQRIDAHRLNDILELFVTEIADREIEPGPHLPVGVLRQTDRARLGDPLQSGGDIDAVAHQVAVALLDDVAKVNADAEFDLAIARHAGVALDHRVLDLDCAAHGVDHERNSTRAPSPVRLITRPLWTAIVGSIRSLRERAQPGKRAVFVRAGQVG